jgi:hypothetical protein
VNLQSTVLGVMLAYVSGAWLMASPAHSQTTGQYLPWTPTSISWDCGVRNGGTFCTLSAYGEQLSAGTTPLTAYGAYRILKGRTAGVGSTLAQNIAAMPCEKIAPTSLRCTATDEVSLGSGVFSVVSPGSSQLNIYSNVVGPLFDWDGDGSVTAGNEGVMLIRYLLGFSAQAVTSGITLTGGKSSDETYRAIKAGIDNGWFQFTATAQPLQATREAEILIRCLNGVRGTPMVAGSGLTDTSAATQRCEAVIAIE